jgi:hypothetical protein
VQQCLEQCGDIDPTPRRLVPKSGLRHGYSSNGAGSPTDRRGDGSSGPWQYLGGVPEPRRRPPETGRSAAGRSWAGAIGRVVVRPGLWPTALRTAARTARTRWWRHPPFLPVPDRAYLAFRLETQYGTGGAPEPRDLVTYLEWCRTEARRRPS